jgi:hypothetical protein
MVAHAGENAHATGDFHCARCHQKGHATRGKKIPKCRNCGGTIFETRVNEPQPRHWGASGRGP